MDFTHFDRAESVDSSTASESSLPIPWSPTPEPENPVLRSVELQSQPIANQPDSLTPSVSLSRSLSRGYEFRSVEPAAGRSTRARLSLEEQTECIKWLLTHRSLFADKNVQKKTFWKQFADWMTDELGKTLSNPDRTVRTWEGKRRQEAEGEIRSSGEPIADTAWKQAMDEWIQFVDDVKTREQEERELKSAEASSQREVTKRLHETLLTRFRDRENSEDLGDESNSIEDPPRRSRKKQKSSDDVEMVSGALTTALDSFTDKFAVNMSGLVSSSSLQPQLTERMDGLESKVDQLIDASSAAKERVLTIESKFDRIMELLNEMRKG